MWSGPLFEFFSSLFALSLTNEAWMANVWNPEGNGGGWIFFFSLGPLMIGS